MKKLSYIIIFAFISLSCEDIDIIEPEGLYEERIIVYGELKANESLEGVRFTKTLPLNEEYDINKAELKEVKAYLKQNGIKIIPIHYTAEGIYKPANLILLKPGDVYELFASYNNKDIYSRTIIPEIPVVSNVIFAGNNFLEATVSSGNKEAYGALWIIKTNPTQIVASDFYEIVNSKTDVPSTLRLRTENIPDEYVEYKTNTYIKITAFDSAYQEYFLTRNNNQPIDDSFSQSGAPIKWNVSGDGVIGLFIGTSESNLILAK